MTASAAPTFKLNRHVKAVGRPKTTKTNRKFYPSAPLPEDREASFSFLHFQLLRVPTTHKTCFDTFMEMPVKKIKTIFWITVHELPCLILPSELKYVFEQQIVINCCELLGKMAIDFNLNSGDLMSLNLRKRRSLYVRLHPSFGCFGGDTILDMKSFHRKRDFLVAVDEAVHWVGDAGRYQGISAT